MMSSNETSRLTTGGDSAEPAMQPPSFLLRRPPMKVTPDMAAAFEALFRAALARPPAAPPLPYRLSAPKWQFLCYVAEHYDVVLHGSGEDAIEIFEPRQSTDVNPFGAQRAVYAASDGLWPIYFAILDRARYPMTLSNTCLRIREAGVGLSASFYFFSISSSALAHRPWRGGLVYLLPRASFVPEPDQDYRGVMIVNAQWASPTAVTPLARLRVGPGDFPLLAQIRGHDDRTLRERALADPDGFPWLDEPE